MMKPKLFSFSALWKPKNVHSLEYLKYLHSILVKNTIVTDQNKNLLVEVLRSIAEILIWGDQNDATVFDFFLEKNMLGFFLRIMKQKCGSYVCVQLLQTLNILFENINSETSSYYLLSNNNVNSIITHRFDFSDEEILAYYISFLKTLSFKLNPNTIHFFFNELTNDFPLYTEAIKFFNHPESMGRIAVRTLTLNVYKVNDPAMITFIKNKTGAPYFSNLVWFIGNHVVEIDLAVQKSFALTDTKSRDKLDCLIAEHLDHIHYTNDILRLGVTSLNDMLTDQMLNRLFLPLYLGSLVPNVPGDGPRITPASALFFVSQVFLILTHTPLVEGLACILLLGDKSLLENGDFSFRVGQSLFFTRDAAVEYGNKTDEEKLQQSLHLLNTRDSKSPDLRRPWFSALLDALNCSLTDYSAFFALCVLYGIGKNEGISPAILECARNPSTNETKNPTTEKVDYKGELVDKLIDIISLSAESDSQVRLITQEICCEVLKLLMSSNCGSSCMSDSNVAALISARENVLRQLTQSCEREEIFLDLFEDELRQTLDNKLNVQNVSSHVCMLSCPTNTPLSGIDFTKRLPCGPQECVRRAIRVYLNLRQCLSSILPEEHPLSLASYPAGTVAINDCLNLTNSDMLACTVVLKDGTKIQRFLVTDGLQVLLVEPDSKKAGWGVVRFVGLLQDVEINGDKEDSRSLFVTVHGRATKKGPISTDPLLSAKFLFDDHIRCMAAKQRLTKGRQKARSHKLDAIKELLDIKPQTRETSRPSTPLAPLLKPVGTRNVPGHAILSGTKNATGSCHQSSETNYAAGEKRAPTSQECRTDGRKLVERASSSSDVIPANSAARRVRVLSSSAIRELGDNYCASNSDTTAQCVDASSKVDQPLADCLESGTRKLAPLAKHSLYDNDRLILNAHVRRCNSMSPRFIPRFSTNEKTTNDIASVSFFGADSSTKAACDARAEMSSVTVIEDNESSVDGQAAGPSIQCFNNKKKSSKSFLIYDI